MAKKGDPDSQLTMGIVYRDGSDGLPQNYLSAMEWFKKAAEQGDAMAQLNLGKLYKNGHCPPIDYVQAHMWFNIAVSTFASQGRNSQSLKYTFNLRDELASKMSSQQINAAQQLAKKWWARFNSKTN